MADHQQVELALQAMAAELRRLEAEFTMFFSGRLPRPPLDSRRRVERMFRDWERQSVEHGPHRFRFATLQARFASLSDLWERGLRAREEGRPGPFAWRSAGTREVATTGDAEDVRHVASFTDPMQQLDRVQELYESLMDARRELGEEVVPFHKFTQLIRHQVEQLQATGASEVSFRVTLRDGKACLTARSVGQAS